MVATRLHDQPYVLSSFLAGFSELVVSRGGRLAEICQQAHVSPEHVLEPNHLLPFDLFIGLLEAAAELLDCPDFSLRLASGQDLRLIGPLASMLDPAQTVEEAIQTITRELPLIVGGFRIEIERQAHIVSFIYRVTLPELEYRRQFQDYLFASTVTTVRMLTGGRFPLRGVFFTRVPAKGEDLTPYDHFFHSPIAFGANNLGLTYDKEILSGGIAAGSLGVQERRGDESAALKRRVTDALALAMPGGKTDLEDIATSLGCSERTLRRRLAAQGVSFSSLRDGLRYALAKEYLQIAHYSLGNIAALLGYANQSAFTRSFQRWSGVTPSEFRGSLARGSMV